MKEMNLPVIAKFLEDLCYEFTDIVESEFTSGNMYNKFNDYIKQNNFKIEMTSTKFGIEIKRYSSIIAGRTSDKRFYKINFALVYVSRPWPEWSKRRTATLIRSRTWRPS
jgi:hypothetical protein